MASFASNIFKVEVGVSVMCAGLLYTVTHITSSSDVIARRADNGALEALAVHLLEPVEDDASNQTQAIKPPRDLSLYSEVEWKQAENRLNIIRPALSLTRRTAADIQAIADKAALHITTIYAWIRLYEDSGEITSLISERRGRKSGSKLISKEAELVIATVLDEKYLITQKLRPKDIGDIVLQRCKAAGIDPPHRNTVSNRIKALAPSLVLRRRGRKDIARNLYDPILGQFPGANHPLSVVQIDHSRCDVILVDDIHRKAVGRPWLTLAIDVFSRMVVGYYLSFETPNATATGLCLARAILPKEGLLARLNVSGKWPVYGFMQAVHADNAKEFRGAMLRRACENYKIDLQLRPVKTPHYGGHIERMMGTVSNELRKLPGATFHTPEARKGYDSEAQAMLTLGEYEEYLVDFFVNVYHQRLHKSLNMSPLKKLELGMLGDGDTPGTGLPIRPMNAERIMIDFLPFVHRTIQPYGLQIDEIQYYSEALNHWINSVDKETGQPRKFVFRRDPRNIDSVHFFDPDLNDYVKIPTRELSLPAVSLSEYIEVKKRLKQEGKHHIDEQAIALGIDRLRAKVEAATAKTKSARRSSQTVQRNREIAALRVKPETVVPVNHQPKPVETVGGLQTTKSSEHSLRPRKLPQFEVNDIFSAAIQPFDDVREVRKS
jgi:putative transposase